MTNYKLLTTARHLHLYIMNFWHIQCDSQIVIPTFSNNETHVEVKLSVCEQNHLARQLPTFSPLEPIHYL